MLPMYTPVKSKRNGKCGFIVGYGTLQWPAGEGNNGDGGQLVPVYLVQVAQGSTSIGPACAVFRMDQVETT